MTAAEYKMSKAKKIHLQKSGDIVFLMTFEIGINTGLVFFNTTYP